MAPGARDADVIIVGAGIVGLATAKAVLRQRPGVRVLILDKEDRVAAHQSGHNSGVIHAGVYYPPGSAKARLCRAGRTAMLAFCAEHAIAHDVCGKIVVATTDDELPRLAALHERCRANRLPVELIDRRGIASVEPFAAGLAALHVPATAIVDFGRVCAVLAEVVTAGGAELRLGCRVEAIDDDGRSVSVRIATGSAADVGSGTRAVAEQRLTAGLLVNCGGLHSDRLARGVVEVDGAERLPTILPFRGEYYVLRPGSCDLVRNLIYPVPDPRFPFLGVHFTRDIHGGVHAGPNAVPALGREAYRWRTIVPADVAESARTPSTWRLARRYWRTEVDEVARSVHKARFVRALQRLVPAVGASDLVRNGAGVRAQAVSTDGVLLDDFAFASSARTLHVLNAPSPAATASLAIGEEIASRLPALA